VNEPRQCEREDGRQGSSERASTREEKRNDDLFCAGAVILKVTEGECGHGSKISLGDSTIPSQFPSFPSLPPQAALVAILYFVAGRLVALPPLHAAYGKQSVEITYRQAALATHVSFPSSFLPFYIISFPPSCFPCRILLFSPSTLSFPPSRLPALPPSSFPFPLFQGMCWVAQFIGHGLFEGRAPALFTNLVQVVLSPSLPPSLPSSLPPSLPCTLPPAIFSLPCLSFLPIN